MNVINPHWKTAQPTWKAFLEALAPPAVRTRSSGGVGTEQGRSSSCSRCAGCARRAALGAVGSLGLFIPSCLHLSHTRHISLHFHAFLDNTSPILLFFSLSCFPALHTWSPPLSILFIQFGTLGPSQLLQLHPASSQQAAGDGGNYRVWADYSPLGLFALWRVRLKVPKGSEHPTQRNHHLSI